MSAAARTRLWSWIAAEEVEAFVGDELYSRERRVPVVGVTTTARGEFLVDPDRLAAELGDQARVVAFANGEATWALADALPARLEVYGGGARIWRPGLARSSNPYDHRLFVVRPGEGDAVARQIVDAVRRSAGWHPETRERAPAASVDLGVTKKGGKPILLATVTEVRGGRVHVAAGAHRGIVGYADERVANLATRFAVGDQLRVFIASESEAGVIFSIQGLGAVAAGAVQPPTILRAPARAPAPPPVDPWQIVAEEYRIGDVVRGRVCLVRERYVLIELLPGAACFCHLSELADAFVRHPDEVVKVGDRVNVELLSLEPEARRGDVSIRRAGFAEPRPAIAPGPGQPAFLDDGPDAPEDRGWGPGEEVPAELRAELDAADADRTALRARLAEVKEQLVALRKELRSANDRLANCEARLRGDDPLASEVAFITAVRVEYARTMGEGDRFEFPLLPMRLHRDFLASARALEGVDVEKIVEVCAQVGCQRAHRLAGREVHVLREGDVGPGIVRDEDGARAWRCAIQINTPSARRLHWWEIPGERSAMGDSRVIEFASVGLHDDVAIPI